MNDLPVHIPCAYEPCTRNAITRIRFKRGWENLCFQHYERHFQHEADEFCRSQNLQTQEEKMAWIKARIGNIGKQNGTTDHWQRVVETPKLPDVAYRYAEAVIGKRNVIEREPGQDDEELAEAPI